jgi:hypothetical protein
MNIRVIKLGTVCTDKATGLTGTLTHWLLNMDKEIAYLFQPRGISPENGQPVSRFNLGPVRLELPENAFETVDVPFEILGSIVTDKASEFTGMAVEFVRHINGCFHVIIQPRGVLEKTNSPIQKLDFDLRRCSGEKIIELTPAEIDRSKKTHPSPTGSVLDTFRPHLPE